MYKKDGSPFTEILLLNGDTRGPGSRTLSLLTLYKRLPKCRIPLERSGKWMWPNWDPTLPNCPEGNGTQSDGWRNILCGVFILWNRGNYWEEEFASRKSYWILQESFFKTIAVLFQLFFWNERAFYKRAQMEIKAVTGRWCVLRRDDIQRFSLHTWNKWAKVVHLYYL